MWAIYRCTKLGPKCRLPIGEVLVEHGFSYPDEAMARCNELARADRAHTYLVGQAGNE